MFDIDILETLRALKPELWLLFASLGLLLNSVSRSRFKACREHPVWWMVVALVGSLVLCVLQKGQSTVQGKVLILDGLGWVTRPFIDLSALLGLLLGQRYLQKHNIQESEFYVLALLSTLGMHVMALSQHLLLLYLGLELMALPTYVMVAMRREQAHAAEAALKYFVMGALASGVFLFGCSLIYGATGSLTLSIILDQTTPPYPLILLTGFVFCLVGVAFKMGLAPFHMWVPDVFEGAPVAATAFLGAAPKIAAFILFWRVFLNALAPLQLGMYPMWLLLGLFSVVLGNVLAVSQNKVRRMLAYSSVAQMGYMILGIATHNPAGMYDHTSGVYAALFYVLNYALTSALMWGILSVIEARRSVNTYADLRGLSQESPLLASVMALLMFSMAGIPPTLGFFAKLGILRALIEQGLMIPALIAMLFAVVGAYYYLKVIQAMYFESSNPLESPHALMALSRIESSVVALGGAGIAVLGVMPNLLSQWCLAALR